MIVDDEPSAQQILKQYIADAPQTTLSGCCGDALEAMEFLKQKPVELILLDINMPKLSGISFLKSAKNLPDVILTTAYDDYALESYELNVVDYLLKPFSFERFLKAVEKVTPLPKEDNLASQSINIKSNGKIYRVNVNKICYIESMGDYVAIHTTENKFITHNTLKNLEEEVLDDNFIRVHKSFIVAVSSIDFIEGNMINVRNKKVPIGATYKQEVKKRFSP